MFCVYWSESIYKSLPDHCYDHIDDGTIANTTEMSPSWKKMQSHDYGRSRYDERKRHLHGFGPVSTRRSSEHRPNSLSKRIQLNIHTLKNRKDIKGTKAAILTIPQHKVNKHCASVMSGCFPGCLITTFVSILICSDGEFERMLT